MMYVAFWFLHEKFMKDEIKAEDVVIIETSKEQEVIRETEKALQVRFTAELGECELWIPKKCILEEKPKAITVKMPKWLADEKKIIKEEIKGYLISETEKAIYFRYHVVKAVWLPKSQIEIKYD